MRGIQCANEFSTHTSHRQPKKTYKLTFFANFIFLINDEYRRLAMTFATRVCASGGVGYKCI